MNANNLPPYENECFVVSPIGDDGSAIRLRADRVFDQLIKPVAEQLGLDPVRADGLGKPGRIDEAIIRHVTAARLVIADLTGANANVYYELALRHARLLPVVLVMDEENLPFDVGAHRVICIDAADPADLADKREELAKQSRESLRDVDEGEYDTIAAIFLRIAEIEEENQGARPPAPERSLMKRAMNANLAEALETPFREAADSLRSINGSSTFLVPGSVARLLVCLDEADDESLVLWRRDLTTDFFDQDVTDYLAHLRDGAPIRQQRLMVFRSPRDEPPCDGETYDQLHELHAYDTFFAIRDLSLSDCLKPLKFGCTLSPSHKCAVIPVAAPEMIGDRRLDPADIPAILDAQPQYDPRGGSMGGIVTFDRPYVNRLAEQFTKLVRGRYVRNLKPAAG